MTSQTGQATVLVLLLGLVGLVITMSVASRSLSDLRQISYVDSGTRAFASAEAVAEMALSEVLLNPALADCSTERTLSNSASVSFQGINNYHYKACHQELNYYDTGKISGIVEKDDVLNVSLDQSTNHKLPIKYNIYWNGSANMSLALLKKDTTGAYIIKRYYAQSDSTCNSITIPEALAHCYSIPDVTDKDVLIRVRPIDASASRIIVEAAKSVATDSITLPSTPMSVTAWAIATDGTQRRVQLTTRDYGLPALFDNVIYSGGNLIK